MFCKWDFERCVYTCVLIYVPDPPQHTVDPFGCQVTLLAHIQFLSPEPPDSFLQGYSHPLVRMHMKVASSCYASAECRINAVLLTFAVRSYGFLTGVYILLFSSISSLFTHSICLVSPFILFYFSFIYFIVLYLLLKSICPCGIIYFVSCRTI